MSKLFAYYNEWDKFAVAWLRELIKVGAIPQGDVDERSITEVQPIDLQGYTQCHFFAGIGGWSLALQLAGWPTDRPVWTGSCPCQPFSAAGKHKGRDDERHLWPEMFRLIRECRPDTVFGEQVERAIGHGWLDGVSADLEGEGYAVGAAVLGAHSVGAPMRKHRLYWVGCSDIKGLERYKRDEQGRHKPEWKHKKEARHYTETGIPFTNSACMDALYLLRGMDVHYSQRACSRLRMPTYRGMAFSESLRPWEQFDLLPCADGWRRVQPGTFPLAHGVPARVGRLRGYGNAIVPQVAAEFVMTYLNLTGD